MPLHIIDTAGLREASDEWNVLVSSARGRKLNRPTACVYGRWHHNRRRGSGRDLAGIIARLPAKLPITVVRNKADITAKRWE